MQRLQHMKIMLELFLAVDAEPKIKVLALVCLRKE